MAKIAIIQEAPYVLDKARTVEQAANIINTVAAQGAELIVFPEAFIPGYPAWIWRLRPGGDWGVSEELHTRLLRNAIDLSSDDLKPIIAAAKSNKVTVVCGMNESDNENSRTTLNLKTCARCRRTLFKARCFYTRSE
ncbi:Nitrilase [Moritella sp. JT01]|uniref:nitrilase-related carbon-nitrogen hydrolase n=1 Tax=Moritella sp. JT01 TaxID=756698 RepID=UPI000791CE23|nr:nitrilase-related carbon-nitrogen hydrolase [Moritella sp. JT01]KXO14286.1 Nitrilase [Moritella sp. JT01]